MKTSTFLAASSAILAAASPIAVDKRRVQTEVVVVVETVTVTDWESYTSTPNAVKAATWSNPAWFSPSPSPVVATPSSSPTPEVASPTPETPTPAAQTWTWDQPAVNEPAASSSSAQTSSGSDDSSSASSASSGSSGSSSGSSDGSYSGVVVDRHNVHRVNNSVSDVSYDNARAGYAATLAATCNFHHDVSIGSADYGQNIAAYGATNAESIGATTAMANAIDAMWYNEVSQYPQSNYGNSNPDMSGFENWGHYTAMVWASTKQVGCATQWCPAGTMYASLGAWYTVCNYYPAGNVDGGYAANVLAPLGQPSSVTPI